MTSPHTITIVVHGPNRFDVFEGERCADGLCWDEVAHLTHPKINEPRYRMQTPEERAAERERWKQRDVAADVPDVTEQEPQTAIPAAAAGVHA